YVLQEGMTVLDPETMTEVAADGQTMGEIMFRGNIVMKGYLKNEKATHEAFAGGWFHTGDLAVLEPDRYVKIKDRSKDVIISGGENISSIEVEDALYRHPAVLACAVVARPDPKWGETPLALVRRDVDARGVVTLTLDRPQSFNALSEGMLAALQSELDAVAVDETARAVVIAASGKAFCAGHDLKEMRAEPSQAYYEQLFS